MKTQSLIQRIALAWVVLAAIPISVPAQSPVDALEVARSVLRSDRNAFVAEHMKFTDQESQDFWPLYREYRAETDRAVDGLVKLVLEYADVYPEVPDEKRAAEMMKDYTAFEEKLAALKSKYARKFAKVLPASKVLRLLQVEGRCDLSMRLAIASAVPLVPESPSEMPVVSTPVGIGNGDTRVRN